MDKEYQKAFSRLRKEIPVRIKTELDGTEIVFTNTGQIRLDSVNFSMPGGHATAFKWCDQTGVAQEAKVYYGPWQNDQGKVRGQHYVAVCLGGSNATVEVNIESRLKNDRVLHYLFKFSSQDGRNPARKNEALAIAREAHMELDKDRLVLGRWDAGVSDFVEGTREVYRRLLSAALVAKKLRGDSAFFASKRLNGRISKLEKNRKRRHEVRGHTALARLEPAKPKGDEQYLVKLGQSEKYRSRSHMSLLNKLADFVRRATKLIPKENKAIDLATEGKSGTVIFEVKIVQEQNPLPDLRVATGQLYEYRFFGVVAEESFLCAVVNHKPPENVIHYLEHDRGIGILWQDRNGFDRQAWTKLNLRNRGYALT